MTQLGSSLFYRALQKYRNILGTDGVPVDHKFDCYPVGVCNFNAATAIKEYYNE